VKTLVTGGSGFLGSHVCDALSERGHDVIVFDTKPSPYLKPGQTMVIGDILDADMVRSVMERCDCVYHFAAIADIAEASARPLDAINVNILGTAHILEAARLTGVARFILASSVYVYSDKGMFYRSTKQASEQLTENYWEVFGLPYTILRFGSLYGPRAGAENAVHRMLVEALQTGAVRYQGNGEEVREYIHVHDAAEASCDMLDLKYANGIYHLMGHERLRTRDMLQMIKEIIGQHIELKFNEGDRVGHYQQTPYSYTPRLGRRLMRESYIDLGLGLLQCAEEIDRTKNFDLSRSSGARRRLT
jgi:UDP-glucose 4-epimerase